MANRAYLYSVSVDESGKPIDQSGILEWNWDYALIQLVLMRGDPRLVESSIWANGPEERIPSILADYDAGVEAVRELFALLGDEHAGDRAEALEFLSDPAHRRSHLLLEIAEIVDMGDERFEDAAHALLDRIRGLDVRAELAALSGDAIRAATGGGYWSQCLYYSWPKAAPGRSTAL